MPMLCDLGADAVMAKIADQDFRAATSNRFPSDENSAPAHSGGVAVFGCTGSTCTTAKAVVTSRTPIALHSA
jgi:hypothetical protein